MSNKREPNPNRETVQAKKRLELVVEFHGATIRAGVVVDGKQVFGSEFAGTVDGAELAMKQFIDIYTQSVVTAMGGRRAL